MSSGNGVEITPSTARRWSASVATDEARQPCSLALPVGPVLRNGAIAVDTCGRTFTKQVDYEEMQ